MAKSSFQFGIEVLMSSADWQSQCASQKVALMAHPASVDQQLNHSVSLLHENKNINLVALFGPQHGMRGDKQDNMIESDHYTDPETNLPVYSLYSEVRRPTDQMMQSFDLLLFDLQDVGCRIYTYLTTLFYMMEACHKHKKSIWVLDRPNPAGRLVEGFTLNMEFESFVGGAPLPMRHGLTLGEAALWYKEYKKLDHLDLKIVEMKNYSLNTPWPQEVAWVNPSPNLPRLSTIWAYSGTVLLEGTTLSEGRGTTRPFEMFGASDIDFQKVLHTLVEQAPALKHLPWRTCNFEPTFHKHQGQMCSGLHWHLDSGAKNAGLHCEVFLPTICILKTIRHLYPEYELWSKLPYEYEKTHPSIDIISGSTLLKEWVDQNNDLPLSKSFEEMALKLKQDQKDWEKQRKAHFLYK